jgi:tRNA-dihydrouridine synthase
MMYSGKFATDPEYRAREFQTHKLDRPLVAHFCGNDPATLVTAAKLIEKDCDAIDLNLGCPQRIAHAGHFGSYLLDVRCSFLERRFLHSRMLPPEYWDPTSAGLKPAYV